MEREELKKELILKGNILIFKGSLSMVNTVSGRKRTFEDGDTAIVVTADRTKMRKKYDHFYDVTVLFDSDCYMGTIAYIHAPEENVRFVL